ncbi:MAG TPA: amidohydrolase [Desulfobulbaceae bacterium]|nr:amidohydrolase [Desulfobulbaceae bacterium]
MHSTVVVHRAPWLFSMAGPVLSGGAVALHDNRIVGTGPFSDLRGRFPGAAIVEHPDCVLMPGLVNAHIHLELSHLAHLSQQRKSQPFVDWLTTMLAERERLGAVGRAVEQAAQTVLENQFAMGVIALADIGNTPLGCSLAAGFPGILFPFREYLGLGRASLVPALKKLARLEDDIAGTAHAPYSTHPELIRALKKRADTLGNLFPLHVAEPASETSLLAEGKGELADFLRRRGFYEDVFHGPGIDISGPVRYLHSLGVLDAKTICVHGVHVSADEISLLRQTGAKVCLCPGSNRFLQVGRAPVAEYLARGILPALGTDSAASNPELSIWREMRCVAEDHPAIDPMTIMQMATIGGAQALGIDADYGTLETGKSASLLAVSIPASMTDHQDVAEYLIHRGDESRKTWIVNGLVEQ